MAEITALNNFLSSLGITQKDKSKMKLTDDDFTGGSPLKLTNLTGYIHNTTIADLNAMVPDLLTLTSLKTLEIHGSGITTGSKNPESDSSADSVIAFNTDNLSKLDIISTTTKLGITIYDQEVCIKKTDLTALNNMTLDYHNPGSNVLSSEQNTAVFCSAMLSSYVAGVTHNTNGVCKDVDTTNVPQGITLPPGSCTSCGDTPSTNLCIKSVSISDSKLVITTTSDGCTQSTTLNNPVSDPQISYTKCTNCGNSKTLLRNEVDEVVDDSSALYNRDSNNEVCNHCLVSIGDEKMCNRFLDKEDCNYLGDSYAWVGA